MIPREGTGGAERSPAAGRPENAPDVSVVVPVFNNAGTLRELHARIARVLEDRGHRFEMIFIDDGSGDDSWKILLDLRQSDDRVRLVRFARNFGQPAALCAGLERGQGETLVTIDADLQNFPEDIPLLLDEMARGHQFVSGYRTRRHDSLITRRIPSYILNRMVHMIVGVKLSDFGCGLNAVARSVAQEMVKQGEMRRFLKPLAAMLAESVSEVPVRNEPRSHGGSGYTLASLVGVQLDFFTSFSRKPFQIIGVAGVALFVLGVIGSMAYLAARFGFGLLPGLRVQAVLVLSMVLGLQFAVLGLLGEFTVRIFNLTQGLPFYVVKEEEP